MNSKSSSRPTKGLLRWGTLKEGTAIPGFRFGRGGGADGKGGGGDAGVAGAVMSPALAFLTGITGGAKLGSGGRSALGGALVGRGGNGSVGKAGTDGNSLCFPGGRRGGGKDSDFSVIFSLSVLSGMAVDMQSSYNSAGSSGSGGMTSFGGGCGGSGGTMCGGGGGRGSSVSS